MKPLKQLVSEELSKYIGEVKLTMIKEVPPEIEGDFSFPCFAHAKKEKKNPIEFAEELAKKIGSRYFSSVEANKGYVNIFIDSSKLASELLEDVLTQKDKFGSAKQTCNVILEHTSANPNAPLHIGHLRNSIIGDSMVRILRFAGCDVDAQFLVNDMGGQLALLAEKLTEIDYKKELKESDTKPDYFLGSLYVKANKEVDPEDAKALQKKYELGDKDIRKIFDFMVDTALTGFKQTFSDYSISMDSFVRESDFVFGGSVEEIVDEFRKSEFWMEKDGMSAVDLEKYGIEKELVLLRSDGTTLYTTRDLAYHVWKLNKANCINVIANEQTLQQKQLRAGLDILGITDVDSRVKHLSYELVTVPGMRMSSRTGEFISADDLLKQGLDLSKKEIEKRKLDISDKEKEKIAKAVAIGAIRFNMVKITPLKPIEFRWEEALNFEGDSSPYLQYSHARATRILEKAGKLSEPDYSKVEFCKEESDLLIHMAKFSDVVIASANDLKPNLVANYLMVLAELFNKFYFKCPVIDSEEPVRLARLTLVKSFTQVMKNGLNLLGIEALKRM